MLFSTYKKIAYIGIVAFLIFVAWLLYAASGSWPAAIGISVFFTILIIPLQLWQLSRLQSRLDDYGGSIPLGWAFDFDLVDDDSDDDAPPESETPPLPGPSPQVSPTNPTSREAESGRLCSNCGEVSWVQGERFCPYCGASLDTSSVL